MLMKKMRGRGRPKRTGKVVTPIKLIPPFPPHQEAIFFSIFCRLP
jgi:hypothetical protein